MSAKAMKKPEKPVVVKQAPVHFIKSNLFRVVHVDGAWGGVTPNGEGLQIALFNDRFPIPRIITYEVDKEGVIGREVSREGRPGNVREVEVELVMSIETSEALLRWLTGMIEKAKQAKSKKGTYLGRVKRGN